jgi:F-box and WD-40 domain protein 1/11
LHTLYVRSLRGVTPADSLQSDELIYFGGSDRKFNALDIASGEIVKDLEGHHDLVRTLVIKPELQRLVSGSYDQDVRVSSIRRCRAHADRRADLGFED